jgi:hypothetical protein
MGAPASFFLHCVITFCKFLFRFAMRPGPAEVETFPNSGNGSFYLGLGLGVPLTPNLAMSRR